MYSTSLGLEVKVSRLEIDEREALDKALQKTGWERDSDTRSFIERSSLYYQFLGHEHEAREDFDQACRQVLEEPSAAYLSIKGEE